MIEHGILGGFRKFWTSGTRLPTCHDDKAKLLATNKANRVAWQKVKLKKSCLPYSTQLDELIPKLLNFVTISQFFRLQIAKNIIYT